MRIRQPAALLAAIIIVFCSVFSAQYTFASENERIYIVYAGSGMDSEAAAELFEKACGKKPLYVYSYALEGFSASMSDTDLKRILSLGMFGEIREASVHTSSEAVECPALLSDSLVKYSTETIGAKEAHDSGYRGAGTVAAVIDCGFDTSHEYFVPSSQVKNILTKEKVASAKLNSSEAVLEYGLDTYLSVKIPYAFNYYDRSVTFLSESSHGTHVAGIIGGSGGTSDGVAPDAQLILMNVGDSKGEKISDYLIFAAFEDALALGADVINLSLGMTAGFSEAEPSEARGYLRLLEKAEELGTEVFCAAGNSGMLGKDSLYDMLYEIAYPKASAPDYGVISAPASFDGAVAVASSDNSVVCLNGYLRYGENY
ncbi:MAG: S8 family serine peptidase, partial [Firmicutes bacterium]|nr:S8 family serine peptidase [Bacillota bacterium]